MKNNYVIHYSVFSDHVYFAVVVTKGYLEFDFGRNSAIDKTDDSNYFFREDQDSKNLYFNNLNKLLRFVKATRKTLI